MGWGENDRGVSFTFGADIVTKFLHKHDFDLLCRAHQVYKRQISKHLYHLLVLLLLLGCRRWIRVLC